jgi:hypothetical protein
VERLFLEVDKEEELAGSGKNVSLLVKPPMLTLGKRLCPPVELHCQKASILFKLHSYRGIFVSQRYYLILMVREFLTP